MKLYATIDFYDEELYAVWNPEMLLQYFALMKNKGISRIYWVDQKEIMMKSGNKTLQEHMQQTWSNFGGNLHHGAVKAAHQVGLEIFVIIKPYEMCVPGTELPSSPNCDGIEVVGGKNYSYLDFARQHPESMLKRCVYPTAKAEKFIITLKDPVQSEGRLNVYASNANKDYRKISEFKLVSGIDSIEIPAGGFKYYLFTLDGCQGGNGLRDILRAVDHDGKRMPVSLAIIPYQTPRDIRSHMDGWKIPKNNRDFLKNGLVFDYLPGIPSGLFSPEVNARREYHFSDPETPALGVSCELNSRIAGFPDPEDPQFRQFIQEWLCEDISYGFDGVEIRLTGHSSPIFWEEYGSGKEIRIRRGNAYKEMLKSLSGMTRNAGRKFGVHIPNLMYDSKPDGSSPMEFYWDFQSWIEEKIPDEITAKLILADGFSPASLAMLKSSRDAGIPVNYCPFIHAVKDPLDYAVRAAAAGVDAFNVYETASIWKGYADGKFIEYDPEFARRIWMMPNQN